MHPALESQLRMNRRYFFGQASAGLGGGVGLLALGALFGGLAPREVRAADRPRRASKFPNFAPKAKRIIYLFQSGGPSQIELFDHKPLLERVHGQEVPTSVYPAERKTTMSAGQASFPAVKSRYPFKKHGDSGIEMSSVLPHLATVADDMCVIRSMHTQAINHDPAITFFQTGSQIAGRPSVGAWLTYGLGSENKNLPGFVAMSSRGTGRSGQPLYDRLWGSGFLPAEYQGVKFRNQGNAVLDINNPAGVDKALRRTMLDSLARLNESKYRDVGDPAIQTRIGQYELAYRMQMSVPELVDFSNEPQHVINLYGKDCLKPGRYAYNCLMARRLAERGVRFIQLFHQGWDQHGNLARQLKGQCVDTDQATAALIKELKNRGMLDETLVVWGGEFGRTVYSQGDLRGDSWGRDHHPNCFSAWMAGGGIKPGMTYGETDDWSVNVAKDGVDVHDLHATMLHLMGIDHRRLTHKYQGRHFRLTDVHGKIVKNILA